MNVEWSKIVTQTYELAEAAVETNYDGVKEISTALISLLKLSDSPRIVNVSSLMATFEVCDATFFQKQRLLCIEVSYMQCLYSFKKASNAQFVSFV